MVEKNESSLNSRINPNKKTENQEKDVLSYLRELVFGIVGVLLVLMLVFRVVVVSGPSMMETLYNGDCLLVLGNVFYSKPEYGDIIVVSKDSFKDSDAEANADNTDCKDTDKHCFQKIKYKHFCKFC